MSQYKSSYPAQTSFAEEYRDFISKFYKISDTPDAHEKYAEQFDSKARLVMASKEATGREGYDPFPFLQCSLFTKLTHIQQRY